MILFKAEDGQCIYNDFNNHHYPKVCDSINLSVIDNNPEYLYDHILLS
ncbi:MAG: hypothetical protein K0S67_1251 [Nitrososphaeraceae archaeon]|jgi:hypothetical protein|nr:hypothetical protein [Nitrososphaeraceae archaeon]MCD6037363.1 hypothetical protein [Nitrososphaeraceae archaeon]MDF2767970.1 hypothetical protein [Nitrososphaeraceae archaeon]